MNKINIRKTELCASTLAHGTEYFGSTVNRDVCMELTDHDLKAGGKVIDTADSHVRWLPGGEHQSEKVIGEWLRERGTRRQIILSTKGTDRRLESMEVPRPSKTEIRDRFQRVRRLQQKYGFSVGKIVIGHLVNQSVPVFALIGPKILANLKDSNSCANTKLSDEDIEYLECGARI
jgi:aryl-alcohol dehydrogenase-like predicted oxidoreductase